MHFVTIDEIAAKWGVSPRQVRSYCAKGRVPGATLDHGDWRIPENAAKLECKSRRTFSTTVICLPFPVCANSMADSASSGAPDYPAVCFFPLRRMVAIFSLAAYRVGQSPK
jgi:hypothetical protein